MSERLGMKKFVFTVEGETEMWYLEKLKDMINSCQDRTYNIAIEAKVQQSPLSFAKRINTRMSPEITHICDVESGEPVYVEKFQKILSEMKDVRDKKKIVYKLGYSNYAFDLWLILHKRDCNGPLDHRKQYLGPINLAFGEKFEDIDHYKREKDFKRCLSQLTLGDVRSAVQRAENIALRNKSDGKKRIQYKGYSYYPDNPALSIHEVVKNMLKECGLRCTQ